MAHSPPLISHTEALKPPSSAHPPSFFLSNVTTYPYLLLPTHHRALNPRWLVNWGLNPESLLGRLGLLLIVICRLLTSLEKDKSKDTGEEGAKREDCGKSNRFSNISGEEKGNEWRGKNLRYRVCI